MFCSEAQYPFDTLWRAQYLGAMAYFLPLPIMLFEILVAFIQATVFMMLTIAYIGSAVKEEH